MQLRGGEQTTANTPADHSAGQASHLGGTHLKNITKGTATTAIHSLG